MSYKFEKQPNGDYDLVINGFEKGIADSPYQGIANIRNLNIKYYEGVAYVNYKRQAATVTGGTMVRPAYATQSQAGIIYISDENGQIFKQSALDSSTFALLGSNPGGGNLGLQFWNNYLLAFASTKIHICGDGTGDAGVTSGNWNTGGSSTGVWPIQNATLTLTGTPAAGDTSATISTYNDAHGDARAFWNGPTGTYKTTMGGQSVYATLTQGVASFSWFPALNASAGSSSATVAGVSGAHASLVSINDGNLYFCNTSNIGSLQLNPNQVFSKGNMLTFTFNSAALALPPTETAGSLVELRNQLLTATTNKIYPWDRISTSWLNPIPMTEQPYGMINILNNIYIFAGNKGNIYISNGYSVERYKKLPDGILGVIDPQWQWGGIMTHRQKLFFQAFASNSQSGTGLLAGIFSIDLDSGALNMEHQNSFGVVSATTTSPGLLIDNPQSALAYDNFYSAWSNGAAGAGGVDYNNTTLYSANEPLIETDLIAVGTFAQSKTFKSMEFKLDQPMQSGDSITIYARNSLSDTYTQVGTTTTAVLSDFYQPINFQKNQWVQFKITMSCNVTATSSSFNRLREIRIR